MGTAETTATLQELFKQFAEDQDSELTVFRAKLRRLLLSVQIRAAELEPGVQGLAPEFCARATEGTPGTPLISEWLPSSSEAASGEGLSSSALVDGSSAERFGETSVARRHSPALSKKRGARVEDIDLLIPGAEVDDGPVAQEHYEGREACSAAVGEQRVVQKPRPQETSADGDFQGRPDACGQVAHKDCTPSWEMDLAPAKPVPSSLPHAGLVCDQDRSGERFLRFSGVDIQSDSSGGQPQLDMQKMNTIRSRMSQASVRTHRLSFIDCAVVHTATAASAFEQWDSATSWRPHVDVLSNIRAFVQGSTFDLIVSVFVIINCILIGAEADMAADEGDLQLLDQFIAFKTMDWMFGVLFFVELLLRVWADGLRNYLCNRTERGWNWFHLVLVALQLMEELLEVLGVFGLFDKTGGSSANLTLFRCLRVLRICRILRVVRVLKLIQELKVIVVSITGSLRHVCWTLLLLLLLMYILAVYLTAVVADHVGVVKADGGDLDGENLNTLRHYFGSVMRSIFTLYQTVSGGIDWDLVMHPLVGEVSSLSGIVLFAFIAFTTVAVFNAVTGVFVESAMESADKAKHQFLLNLVMSIFNKVDIDSSCRLSRAEFKAALSEPEMAVVFETLDVDLREAETLFELIDTNCSGEIDVREFVSGCFRLRGPAKSIQFNKFLKTFDSYVAEVNLHSERTDRAIQWMVDYMREQAAQSPEPWKIAFAEHPPERLQGRVFAVSDLS